jgi:hypothetical protein
MKSSQLFILESHFVTSDGPIYLTSLAISTDSIFGVFPHVIESQEARCDVFTHLSKTPKSKRRN